jgi:hypothetical protein
VQAWAQGGGQAEASSGWRAYGEVNRLAPRTPTLLVALPPPPPSDVGWFPPLGGAAELDCWRAIIARATALRAAEARLRISVWRARPETKPPVWTRGTDGLGVNPVCVVERQSGQARG